MKILRILEIGWLVISIFVALLTIFVFLTEGLDNDTYAMLFVTALSFVMYSFRRRKRRERQKEL